VKYLELLTEIFVANSSEITDFDVTEFAL